jgi:hypothetical protein
MIDGLIPVFNEMGFKFIGGPANHFRRPVKEDIAEVYFNVLSSGRVYFSKVILSVKAVEEVVLSIGIPSMDLTSYLSAEDCLPTLQDQKEHSTDVVNIYPIENKSQLEEFISGLKLYMKDRGIAFAEYYHHLPNALKAMDALEKEGQQWHQLLGGGADHLFRGLVISKICADQGFEQKIRRTDAIFYDASFQLEEWIPHYEKLKERLLTMEPKYKYEG